MTRSAGLAPCAAVGLLLTVGCGPSSFAPGWGEVSLSGSAASPANTAVAAGVGLLADGGQDLSSITIAMSALSGPVPSGGICVNGVDGAGTTVGPLQAGVQFFSGSTLPLTPGTYPIVPDVSFPGCQKAPNGSALCVDAGPFSFVTVDEEGGGDQEMFATSGTATLTEVGSTFVGSFSGSSWQVSPGVGPQTLSGTFSAPFCSFP